MENKKYAVLLELEDGSGFIWSDHETINAARAAAKVLRQSKKIKYTIRVGRYGEKGIIPLKS